MWPIINHVETHTSTTWAQPHGHKVSQIQTDRHTNVPTYQANLRQPTCTGFAMFCRLCGFTEPRKPRNIRVVAVQLALVHIVPWIFKAQNGVEIHAAPNSHQRILAKFPDVVPHAAPAVPRGSSNPWICVVL